MSLLTFAYRNLTRRPLRTLLAFLGLSAAIGTLAILEAFGTGYQRGLRAELDRTGLQMMLVPLGCPYDAAARVLKGQALDATLPASALEQVRHDPAVAVAAPLFLKALPRADENRTDLWVGIDEHTPVLKPWWRVAQGQSWFDSSNSVILGSEAAAAELRVPGDQLHCPEASLTFSVVGILQRSGTSDDSLFFLPIESAQAAFGEPGRLTAIAIRLRDPALLSEASRRLQDIPGAQVVTLTEVMGVFLNLIGSTRALLTAISIVALAAGVLGVLNTMLTAVVERTNELALLRALGASRIQVFLVITCEAILLTTGATLAGLAFARLFGPSLEDWMRRLVPLTPDGTLTVITPELSIQCLLVGIGVGLIAAILPGLRAVRLAPARALQPV